MTNQTMKVTTSEVKKVKRGYIVEGKTQAGRTVVLMNATSWSTGTDKPHKFNSRGEAQAAASKMPD